MKTELDKLRRIKQEVYHDEVLYTYMCELIARELLKPPTNLKTYYNHE